MSSINSRIKQIRLHFELTQKSLGDKVGVKWYQIKDIETGKTKPSVEILIALCENLAISSDWLLTGKGNILSCDTSINDDGTSNVTKVLIEHQSILKRFKDPERGLRINQRILYIQDTSDELFDKTDTLIEGLYEAAKTIDGVAKKKSEDKNDLQNKLSS